MSQITLNAMSDAIAHSKRAMQLSQGTDSEAESQEAHYKTIHAAQRLSPDSLRVAAEMHEMAAQLQSLLYQADGPQYPQSLVDAHNNAAAELRRLAGYYPGTTMKLKKGVRQGDKYIHDQTDYEEDDLFDSSGDWAGYGHPPTMGGPSHNVLTINTIDDPDALLLPFVTASPTANYNPGQPRDKRGRWTEGQQVKKDIKGEQYNLTKVPDGWHVVRLAKKTDRFHRHYVVGTDASGNARECSCPDFFYKKGCCKHMSAVNELEREASQSHHVPPTAVGNSLVPPPCLTHNANRERTYYANETAHLAALDDATLVPASCISHLGQP